MRGLEGDEVDDEEDEGWELVRRAAGFFI